MLTRKQKKTIRYNRKVYTRVGTNTHQHAHRVTDTEKTRNDRHRQTQMCRHTNFWGVRHIDNIHLNSTEACTVYTPHKNTHPNTRTHAPTATHDELESSLDQ